MNWAMNGGTAAECAALAAVAAPDRLFILTRGEPEYQGKQVGTSRAASRLCLQI